MTTAKRPGKGKNHPRRIYLQVRTEDGEESAEVTWCADRINKTDVAYVRADTVKKRKNSP